MLNIPLQSLDRPLWRAMAKAHPRWGAFSLKRGIISREAHNQEIVDFFEAEGLLEQMRLISRHFDLPVPADLEKGAKAERAKVRRQNASAQSVIRKMRPMTEAELFRAEETGYDRMRQAERASCWN